MPVWTDTRPEVFYKAVAVNGRRSAAPTARELELINGFARRALQPDEVYVGECDLCNDRVDRAFERFPVEVLQDFARSLPGKSLLAGHDRGSLPLGLWFDARLRSDQLGVTHLRPSYYMVKTRENEHHRAQLDGGVYRYASVGFRAQDLLCDICGKSWFGWECQHYPGQAYYAGGKQVIATAHYARSDGHPAEAVEGSIVYLGCQYDAELKAAMAQRSFGGIVMPRMRRLAVRAQAEAYATPGGRSRGAPVSSRGLQDRAPEGGAQARRARPGDIERAIKQAQLDQLVAAHLTARGS